MSDLQVESDIVIYFLFKIYTQHLEKITKKMNSAHLTFIDHVDNCAPQYNNKRENIRKSMSETKI